MMQDKNIMDFGKKKGLCIPALPEALPYKCVREYLYSKAADQMIKRKPEWDVALETPKGDLTEAVRELLQAEGKLAVKRQEQVEQRKEKNQLWEELQKKEEDFRNSFLHYNKFVEENQEKRDRAHAKIAEIMDHQYKRKMEIEETKELITLLSRAKDNMERNIKQHRIYEEYLQSVVNATSDFNFISDILNRYETLVEAKKELSLRQEMDLLALEKYRNYIIKMIEDNSKALMGFNNEIGELQSRHNDAKDNTLKWERIIIRIKQICSIRQLELDQVKMASCSLYRRMCQDEGKPPTYDKNDIENQMRYIKDSIEQLKHIVKVANIQLKKEALSNVTKQTHLSTSKG